MVLTTHHGMRPLITHHGMRPLERGGKQVYIILLMCMRMFTQGPSHEQDSDAACHRFVQILDDSSRGRKVNHSITKPVTDADSGRVIL
jgi:hypothetical protein